MHIYIHMYTCVYIYIDRYLVCLFCLVDVISANCRQVGTTHRLAFHEN